VQLRDNAQFVFLSEQRNRAIWVFGLTLLHVVKEDRASVRPSFEASPIAACCPSESSRFLMAEQFRVDQVALDSWLVIHTHKTLIERWYPPSVIARSTSFLGLYLFVAGDRTVESVEATL